MNTERLQDVTLAERLRACANPAHRDYRQNNDALLREAAAALSVRGNLLAYTWGDDVILARHWTGDDPPEGWTPLYATPPAPDATKQEPQS